MSPQGAERRERPNDLEVVEIEGYGPRRHLAESLLRSAAATTTASTLEGVLQALRETRKTVPALMAVQTDRFVARAEHSERDHVYFAETAAEAAAITRLVVGEPDLVAVNRAAVIDELQPHLEADGYRLVSSYISGPSSGVPVAKAVDHFWELPELAPEETLHAFSVHRIHREGLHSEYSAVVGVAAAAAEDGSLWFLQHGSNISEMLRRARSVVVLVGQEKIVPTRAAALLQARCMGTFGLPSIVVDWAPGRDGTLWAQLKGRPATDAPQDVRVVVLDNGRSAVAADPIFAPMLTCIACRRCALWCPTHRYFRSDGAGYPRQYLWSALYSCRPDLEFCVGCGRCRLACPLEIEIPSLMASARGRLTRNPIVRARERVLHDPYPALRMASSLAPLANLLVARPSIRRAMEHLVGIQRLTALPKIGRPSLTRQLASGRSR